MMLSYEAYDKNLHKFKGWSKYLEITIGEKITTYLSVELWDVKEQVLTKLFHAMPVGW